MVRHVVVRALTTSRAGADDKIQNAIKTFSNTVVLKTQSAPEAVPGPISKLPQWVWRDLVLIL